jgi:hypothetical protein
MGGKYYAQHDDECPMRGGVRPVQQAAGAFSRISFGRAKDLQKGDIILIKRKTMKATVGFLKIK